jgi:dipeptidyl aminopeptidase/acylaminoacyl peptidase
VSNPLPERLTHMLLSNIRGMMLPLATLTLGCALVLFASKNAQAQETNLRTSGQQDRIDAIEKQVEAQGHIDDALLKHIDDLLWYQRVGDIAQIEKIRYTGPARYEPNPTAQDFGNPLIVSAYTFVPRNVDRKKTYPLLVFPHGGVHGSFLSDDYAVIVRELIEQGYVVVAPEYRGSRGYGAEFYNQIDYGGKEIEDVYLSGQWVLKHYKFTDPQRVGIVGWSHGGFLTLWNIFNHPEAYKVAYAGVPASNLALRAGTKAQGSRGYPSADYGAASGIGKSAFDDVKEYVRRSPAYNADKLQTPLLIHSDTNDSDVNVFEVEQLIDALKARGKKFEYKVYQDPPGEHFFEQLDTEVGREARLEVYKFMARYLDPPNSLTATDH